MNFALRLVPWGNKPPLVPANSVRTKESDRSELYLAGVRLRNRVTRLSFIGLVVLPTLVMAVYEGLIVTPRYVSESQFIVRSVNGRAASGLDAFFQTIGISRAADDGTAVQKYIISRDAMDALNHVLPLRKLFGQKKADFISRYPRFWQADNDEYLFEYYQNRVSILEDDARGIIILKASSFDAQDAKQIVTQLLVLAEGMVNRLNQRAQLDTIDSAQQDVARAEKQTIKADGDVAAFRTRELLVDPGKSSLSVIELIGSLTAELSQTTVLLKDAKALSPSGPQIASLQARIASLEDRIKIERAKLVGTDTSLSSKISEFEHLTLLRIIADKTLEAALGSLDNARQDARRQHIYIEQVVSPNLPDEPTEPERFRMVLTTLVFGFAIFSVVWILSVGVGEHSQ